MTHEYETKSMKKYGLNFFFEFQITALALGNLIENVESVWWYIIVHSL